MLDAHGRSRITFDDQSCHTAVYYQQRGSSFRPLRNTSFRRGLLFAPRRRYRRFYARDSKQSFKARKSGKTKCRRDVPSTIMDAVSVAL